MIIFDLKLKNGSQPHISPRLRWFDRKINNKLCLICPHFKWFIWNWAGMKKGKLDIGRKCSEGHLMILYSVEHLMILYDVKSNCKTIKTFLSKVKCSLNLSRYRDRPAVATWHLLHSCWALANQNNIYIQAEQSELSITIFSSSDWLKSSDGLKRLWL